MEQSVDIVTRKGTALLHGTPAPCVVVSALCRSIVVFFPCACMLDVRTYECMHCIETCFFIYCFKKSPGMPATYGLCGAQNNLAVN